MADSSNPELYVSLGISNGVIALYCEAAHTFFRNQCLSYYLEQDPRCNQPQL